MANALDLQGPIISFCNDPLWRDFNSSFTASLPFTWCFQHAVLAIFPLISYVLMLPILFIQARISVRPPLPEDFLTSMKSGLTVLLIADKEFLLIRTLWERYGIGEVVPLVEYILPVLQITTLLSMLSTTKHCLNKGIGSSGPIFCTWLLFVLCGLPEFYTWLMLGFNPETLAFVNTYEYIAYLVFFPLLCLQLVLQFFTLQHSDLYKNLSPESQASFFSRQFFCWFNPIVRSGRANPLVTGDLYELEPEMSGQFLYKEWRKVWSESAEKYNKKRESHYFFETYQELHHIDDKTPLTHTTTKLMNYGSNHECVKPKNIPDPAPPSIIRRLFQLFKWQFIGSTIAKLISDILQYVNPLLLGALITFVGDKQASIWKGIGLAVLMFLVAEMRSLLMNQYFNSMNRVAMKIQSILTSAVYDKVLKLSNSARQERTLGEIINLMAIDVDRFQSITPQIQNYWSSPLSIIIALTILYKTIGWSAGGGLLVFILLIPCNALVIIKNKKFQTQQMRIKDERLKLTNEALNGIRVVKLYAWEQAMIRKINVLRKEEVSLIQKAALTRSIVDVGNVAAPFLVAAISFALYTLTSEDHILTPQIAFVAISVFAQIRAPLFLIADLIGQTVQMIVSNKRLKRFLVASEIDDQAVLRDTAFYYKNAIDVETATFSWNKDAEIPTLRNLQLEIPKGQLICIVGEVGAGKSSLLSALLNEMEKIHGFVGVHGRVAYVPQQSWIQSMTIRKNILFNKTYDAKLYQEVINACALEKDFEFLPDGDLTMIGEKGVNLSGGQKARVSLARALYHKSEILMLDDPLSAVDAIVGKTIFDKALGPHGLARDTTRILVTHSQIPLEYADAIVVMRNGEFFRIGTYSELLRDDEANQLIHKLESDASPIESTSASSNAQEDEMSSTSVEDEPPRSIKDKRKSKASSKIAKSEKVKLERKPLTFAEEYVETTRVRFGVYVYYLQKMGIACFSGFLIFLVLNFAFSLIRSFWLSNWSDNAENDSMNLEVRLSVFVGLGTFEILFLYVSNVFLIFATVNSSIRLHLPLLCNMLCAPIQFFDTTPLGRIINRFSKDIEVVDLRLSGAFRFLFICTLSVTSTIVVITISTPAFIFIIIPLLIIYALIIRFYIPTARQLQRLISTTRSPIFSIFSETIQGVSSIRAYGVASQFYNEFCYKLDVHIKCKYHSLASNRWLSMRLEILGNIVILSAALLGVLAKQYGLVTAGIIGLSVSYSLNMTNMLNFLLKSLSDVETNIVSVERISEFSNVEEEADWDNGRHGIKLTLPKNWPTHGSVLFKNLSVRYRPELDYALIDINAEISGGEKIGIVGRTGAGKSSLALALFRMIEPTQGQIFIDGTNITQLGLHTIRRKLTVIPQDPVLFSGSIRFNLDPFYHHTDSELWQALADSNLKSFVQSLPQSLNHQISEGGQNISVGQRQLLCLARAILRRSKIIVIDEGTANVDMNTDKIIQQTIREKFAECTVLTIAHRIDTVMDYNRIMVLQHGKLVEFDTPANLLRDNNSVFYSLVNSK